MKAVENIQFVIYTDKWPNTYLYPPVYVTYIKPEFHVQHLSKKKDFPWDVEEAECWKRV